VEVQVLSSAPIDAGHTCIYPFFNPKPLKPAFMANYRLFIRLTLLLYEPIIPPLVVAGWSSLVARRAHNP
jgi:hypothetical protein